MTELAELCHEAYQDVREAILGLREGNRVDRTLIENLKTKMSDFKTQMDAYEEALYDKYDAMETAIQQLNTQLGYITGGN